MICVFQVMHKNVILRLIFKLLADKQITIEGKRKNVCLFLLFSFGFVGVLFGFCFKNGGALLGKSFWKLTFETPIIAV